MEELMEYDIPAYIDDSGPFYLVQIGDYRDLDEAAAMEQRVKRGRIPGGDRKNCLPDVRCKGRFNIILKGIFIWA